jgi:flagellar hook-associated protein 3 FlgL
MRITNKMVVQSTLLDLNSSLTRLQDSQADLSSGRLIRKMSDDPARAVSAMTVRNELRRAERHARTADETQTSLQVTDTALLSGLDIMSRVKELAVRASNSGASDATSRAAISSELSSIREELLALANTKHLDRPIFNGTATGPAYDIATGAYLGNAATIVRDVAPDVSIAANITGEQVFGSQTAPGGDLFAVLDRLQTAITGNDPNAIALEHTRVDEAASRMRSAAAEIGSRSARLEGIQTRSSSDTASMRERLSAIEDVDLAEAIIATKTHETAYNAALQAAARVIPPSLLDYLR